MRLSCPEAASLSAHRLDEVLQAAQISITQSHVTILLYQTPGVEVADRFLHLLDRNADDTISADEGRAFAQQVVAQLRLDVDGSTLGLSLETSQYPTIALMRSGEGSVRLEARGAIPPLEIGRHALTFTNNFDPGQGVYLANAMLPRDPAIAIFEQERTNQQKTLRIEFGVTEPPRRWLWWLVLGLLAVTGGFVAYRGGRPGR